MNTQKPGSDRPYTYNEFLSIVKKIAEEKKLDYLDRIDYLLASEKEEQMTSDDIDFRSDTHYGPNEGIYTDFHIACGKDRRHVFTAKTLGDSDEDYIKMHVLAANICLIASEYIKKHNDEFNWTGFDVSYIKDGKTVPCWWCGKKENAIAKAEELKAKGYKTVIRDNNTRKNVG